MFLFPCNLSIRFSFRSKVKSPPQDTLLKLEKELTFNELSQESSMFAFKLGLANLQCCLLMNGLVLDSTEVHLLKSLVDSVFLAYYISRFTSEVKFHLILILEFFFFVNSRDTGLCWLLSVLLWQLAEE